MIFIAFLSLLSIAHTIKKLGDNSPLLDLKSANKIILTTLLFFIPLHGLANDHVLDNNHKGDIKDHIRQHEQLSHQTNNHDIQTILDHANSIKASSSKKGLMLAKKALELIKKKPSYPLKIRILVTLAQMEISHDHRYQSKVYLEQVIDILNTVYSQKEMVSVLIGLVDANHYLNELIDIQSNIKDAIDVAQTLENTILLFHLHTVLGTILVSTKKIDLALKEYQQAVLFAQKLNNPSHLILAHANLAHIYSLVSNNTQSIHEYLKTIELANKETHYPDYIHLYIGLWAVYLKEENQTASANIQKKIHDEIHALKDSHTAIEYYRNLGFIYSQTEDIQTSLQLYTQALRLLEKDGNLQEIAEFLEYIAINQRKLSQYKSALENAKRALSVQRSLDDKKRVAKLLLNLSIIYRKLSSYDQALEYAIELTSLHESTNNLNGMAGAYNTTGLIYLNLKRNAEAKRYYEQTLDLPPDQIQRRKRADALRALAEIYQKSAQYDEALWYAKEAKFLYAKIPSLSGAESVNRTMADIYRDLGENDKALDALETALNQSRKIKDLWSQSTSLIKIASLLLDSNLELSINYANEGVLIGHELSSKLILLEGYQVLMTAEEKLGNYKSANYFAKEIYRLTREISKDEITQRVAELRIVRETEQREREILILKREAKIKQLELNSASSELEILSSKNTISSLQLERERNTRIILLGLSLLVILALALLINRYHYSRQKQVILRDKNIQIESKNTKLEELNATKDRFFSIIAHDLRGPISSLVSLSELISDDFDHYDSDQLLNYIKTIHKSSEQTYNLLDELLEWAMQQLRNTDPIPRQHASHEICQSAITNLESVARSKNITIYNNVDHQSQVYADRNMINTVIRNLLTNALKFTPQNGKIDINAQTHPLFTTIHIKDYGVGIAPQYLDTLFQIDKNVSQLGTNGEKGTGFGLSLCKDLIQKNGGKICVTSCKDKGSDFYFQLPNRSSNTKNVIALAS